MNNVYNEISIPDDTPTVVNGLTVPDRAPYSLNGLIISCEADLLVEIKVNVDTKFKGFVTGSVQTLPISFAASPFGLNAGDVVTVIATQADPLTPPASYMVYSTLLVEQL